MDQRVLEKLAEKESNFTQGARESMRMMREEMNRTINSAEQNLYDRTQSIEEGLRTSQTKHEKRTEEKILFAKDNLKERL